MKKHFKGLLMAVLSLAVAGMAMMFVACGDDDSSSTSSSSTSTSTSTSETDTSADDKEYNLDFAEEDLYDIVGDGAIYATTIGQAELSTLTTVIDNAIGDADIEYTSDSTLEATDVQAGDTVFIVVGMSSKGLGSAGVDQASEEERAQAFADIGDDINIIACHLGEAERRGTTSDTAIEIVVGASKVTFVIDSGDGTGGDYDNMISDLCEENGIPCYLYTKVSKLVTPFEYLLGIEE